MRTKEAIGASLRVRSNVARSHTERSHTRFEFFLAFARHPSHLISPRNSVLLHPNPVNQVTLGQKVITANKPRIPRAIASPEINTTVPLERPRNSPPLITQTRPQPIKLTSKRTRPGGAQLGAYRANAQQAIRQPAPRQPLLKTAIEANPPLRAIGDVLLSATFHLGRWQGRTKHAAG